jgi:hypothetical protein
VGEAAGVDGGSVGVGPTVVWASGVGPAVGVAPAAVEEGEGDATEG